MKIISNTRYSGKAKINQIQLWFLFVIIGIVLIQEYMAIDNKFLRNYTYIQLLKVSFLLFRFCVAFASISGLVSVFSLISLQCFNVNSQMKYFWIFS